MLDTFVRTLGDTVQSTVRTRHGLVETQSLVLKHPATGHAVELIGVLHVADKAFWSYLNKLMRRRVREGYIVHYELITGSEAEVSQDRAGKMMRRFGKTMQVIVSKARAAGLTYQLDAIRYPVGSVNTDMTKQQLRHAFASVPWTMPAKLWVADHVLQAVPVAMFKEVLATTLAASKTSLGSGGINDAIILDERNLIASRAALASRQPVIAIWGAAHLPGIAANLKKAGYHVVSQRWVPVYAYNSCTKQ